MYLSLWALAPLAPKSNQIQLRAKKRKTRREWGVQKKEDEEAELCSITRARFVPYVNLAAATTNNLQHTRLETETETEAKANNKTKVAATAAAAAAK